AVAEGPDAARGAAPGAAGRLPRRPQAVHGDGGAQPRGGYEGPQGRAGAGGRLEEREGRQPPRAVGRLHAVGPGPLKGEGGQNSAGGVTLRCAYLNLEPLRALQAQREWARCWSGRPPRWTSGTGRGGHDSAWQPSCGRGRKTCTMSSPLRF